MRLNTRQLEKLRPPEIVISERLLTSLHALEGGKCLFLGIRLSRGPCNDDWCEPIKKAFVKMVDKCDGDESSIVAEIRWIRILIDGELYHSASKLRNRIVIDTSRKGQLKVDGLTAY